MAATLTPGAKSITTTLPGFTPNFAAKGRVE